MNFAVLIENRVKIKESVKWEKYHDHARKLKTTMKHESNGDTNCSWCTLNNLQKIDKRLEDPEIKGLVESVQHYYDRLITEKSLNDLRRLAVSQTLVRNHQLKLVRKTLKRVK